MKISQNNNADMDNIIAALQEKFGENGQWPETYLKGLLCSKPLNYWDYIGVETLLSLQISRTSYKDEEIFIIYHQITELVLKMIIHEIEQLVYDNVEQEKWLIKADRIIRYTNMLISSFDVMKFGLDYDDYNTFRNALFPASGYQSIQFRIIEIYLTGLQNLLSPSGRKRIKDDASIKDHFGYMYWQEAGINKNTGKKSLTLEQFEKKYLAQLIALANKVKGQTVEDKLLDMKDMSPELKKKMKEFDHLYNVIWPHVHLQTAQHFMDKKGEHKAAIANTEWKKYLHPRFQQRKFFPLLWSDDEIKNWGLTTNL